MDTTAVTRVSAIEATLTTAATLRGNATARVGGRVQYVPSHVHQILTALAVCLLVTAKMEASAIDLQAPAGKNILDFFNLLINI